MDKCNLIEMVGVQKSYDGTQLVIPDLNLSIRRGEFLTLLGASGSGKTTTLMMLAGFENPTRGQIMMDGRPIQDVPAHQRGIGMVFQNYALFPHMTVAENLAYPLKMRGLGKTAVKDKVGRAMELVQLSAMGERKPAQLSGGQQQRVALARALVFDPELVLMDEPLGALDKNLREHMQFEIKQIHRQLGVTVVYVTHDQSEALTMSDRVAVFHDGRIEQLAPPAELYDRPATSYIASFIGENNGFNGVLTDAGLVLEGGVCLPLPGHGLQPGQRARALVRPESVRISKDMTVRVQARIADMAYLGDHTRLVARLDNGDTIVAKLTSGALPEDTSVDAPLVLGWELRNMLVFPQLCGV
jgi:putative spermidine/putrescine transport system ATP-binding protein